MNIYRSARNIYCVGVSGVAVTAFAQIAVQEGKRVSGCDTGEVFVTDEVLKSLKIAIDHGFTSSQLPDECDLVVHTGAHGGKQNPIVLEAVRRQIPVLSISEVMGQVFAERDQIAVCGVGGKSTISAMLAWIFEQEQLSPGYAVGVGKIHGLEWTGRAGDSHAVAVIEADEYAVDPSTDHRPRFSFLQPKIAVVTHILFDHPDIYKNETHTFQTFADFVNTVPHGGSVVIWHESLNKIKHLLRPDLNLIIVQNENIGQVTLSIPGEHNRMNAALALQAAIQAGVPTEHAMHHLKKFRGTMRRLDDHGEKAGFYIFDDYGHHPNELQAAIQAIREWRPSDRVVVLFEPHTYSRTKHLKDDFVIALSTADEIYLLDIFPSAREEIDPSISSDDLVQDLVHRGKSAKNLHTISQAASYLLAQTPSVPTTLLTLGAGNVYQVIDHLE